MEAILQVVKSLLIPDRRLMIPVEDVPMVRGYYERINRCAIHVDSEVVSPATEQAFVFPRAGEPTASGPFCPLY